VVLHGLQERGLRARSSLPCKERDQVQVGLHGVKQKGMANRSSSHVWFAKRSRKSGAFDVFETFAPIASTCSGKSVASPWRSEGPSHPFYGCRPAFPARITRGGALHGAFPVLVASPRDVTVWRLKVPLLFTESRAFGVVAEAKGCIRRSWASSRLQASRVCSSKLFFKNMAAGLCRCPHHCMPRLGSPRA